MRGLSCTYPVLDQGEQQLLCCCSKQSRGSRQAKTALGLEPDPPLREWMFGGGVCSHPCDIPAARMWEQHCWAASGPRQVGKDEEPCWGQ